MPLSARINVTITKGHFDTFYHSFPSFIWVIMIVTMITTEVLVCYLTEIIKTLCFQHGNCVFSMVMEIPSKDLANNNNSVIYFLGQWLSWSSKLDSDSPQAILTYKLLPFSIEDMMLMQYHAMGGHKYIKLKDDGFHTQPLIKLNWPELLTSIQSPFSQISLSRKYRCLGEYDSLGQDSIP